MTFTHRYRKTKTIKKAVIKVSMTKRSNKKESVNSNKKLQTFLIYFKDIGHTLYIFISFL